MGVELPVPKMPFRKNAPICKPLDEWWLLRLSRITRETAEGLDYRFLRSQPSVIGLGLLRRARPQQSDYNTNTQLKGPIINASLSALQIHTYAR